MSRSPLIEGTPPPAPTAPLTNGATPAADGATPVADAGPAADRAPADGPSIDIGLVGRFDRWVDDCVVDRMQGNAAADRLFYSASALGDHGLIWLILSVLRGLRSDDSLRVTGRAAAAIGIESIVVNGPVKWIFRRQRPARPGTTPHPLRVPRTSSFPSGHATSAFCAAALLSESDPARRRLFYAVAVVVAWSRVHVRVHYASDVVGGALIGAAMGEAFKRLLPLAPPTK